MASFMARYGFVDESRILGKVRDVSAKTSERVQKPFADDFACAPEALPAWSCAVDFDAPVTLPSGEAVKGLRFMDFKDCTNHYVLNSRNEARPLFGLGDADLEALLGFMDGFADGRKAQMRRQAAAARYAGFVKAAGQGVPNGRKPKV
jgi:hypothetical protein